MVHASWKAYFYFSQKEIKGIVVLGGILFGSVLLSWLLPHSNVQQDGAKNNDLKLHLFYFDPNTIDSIQAIQLGLPEKQVKSLLHYREKGGYFKSPDDFARLYGLSPELFSSLRPYVQVKKSLSKTFHWNKYSSSHVLNGNEEVDWKLDINTATANEWQEKTHFPLNIIQHIMAYKNYLGAFTSAGQVGKVYGLSDSAYQTIRHHLYIAHPEKIMLNANTMRYSDWQQMGLFTDKQISLILKLRKEQGGRIGWREIAEKCDLSQEEAIQLRSRAQIDN